MKIIDSHAHIFPKKIEAIASRAIGTFYDHGMAHSGSPEELIETGSRAGVTGYAVFSTATTPVQVSNINDFILEQCEKHPEFIGIGTMHPGFEEYRCEIDRIYEAGIRGIKLHPDFQRIYIDCDELMPIFEHMQAKNMFLITHSGDPRHHFSAPERVARVAGMFPDMDIIAAHFGGWMEWELARRVLCMPNVYYDTSSTFGYGGLGPVVDGFKHFDNSRIIFGVDFPMWEHSDELKMLKGLGLREDVLEGVLSGNFERLYEKHK